MIEATVAIVIVTYNSADSVGGLLESITPAWPGHTPYIVVVDNGSSDNTTDIVAKCPGVVLIKAANDGYAAGINRGVEASPEADVHLILNPDLRLHPNSVQPMLNALEDPTVGIVAPHVLGKDGNTEFSLRREPTLARAVGLNFTGLPMFAEYVTGEDSYAHASDADWALGAALMITRPCRDQVGPWDESFFLYSEETDYCLRARDLGWRTRYVPTATVTHIGGGSGRNDKTHMMQIVNKVRLYARRKPRAAAWLYWGLTVISESSWIARGHRQSKASVRALLRPAARPPELGCSDHVLPE